MIGGNLLVLQQWDGKGFEKTAGDGLRYDFITHFVKFILFGQRMMHVRNCKFKSTKFIHTRSACTRWNDSHFKESIRLQLNKNLIQNIIFQHFKIFRHISCKKREDLPNLRAPCNVRN